jgi:hypothetical protein
VTEPVIVLGVRRSGTTLLRVMLDCNSQIAVPDESFFVPQLAHRHGSRPNLDAFVEDLRRLPTLRDWGVDIDDVRMRLRPGMPTGDAIATVFETYAAARGKERWGDKTPLYMQHLRLLERLFPHALFVHLIRDGRDAALSFLAMPQQLVTQSWAHPRTAAAFACQWRMEVDDARALGRRVGPSRYLEVRYETLVAEPERELRRICDFAALPFEPAMLEYSEHEAAEQPHQQSLTNPPTPGLRDWRREMSADGVAAFESVAGELLAELGYETRSRPKLTGALRLLAYRARLGAWNASAYALQRSPLWRRRHQPL